MSSPPAPLEPDRATWERWLHVFGDLCTDALGAMESHPAHGRVGADGLRIAAAQSRPIGEDPAPGGPEAVARLLEHAAEAALYTPGPGYLAYVPGGGLPASAIADLVAGVLNRFTGLAPAAPAFVRLEADVLAWLAAQFGYDPGARGIFTSGGSLANLSAIVTARHARFGDDSDFSRATAYVSSQAHHSVAKSLALAGIARRQVRSIEVDERLRLHPPALRAAITQDRAAGHIPFVVVTAGGSTNTGAVDPLGPVADICEALGVWHHVDGAYGGAFVLCEEGRRRLAGIERADSIAFDPHKGMFLPYGTGCLLVKDGDRLRQAHGAGGDYLQDLGEIGHAAAPPSPADYGPELSRGFRGLRLWLPLMLHGAAPFREALAEKLALAQRLWDGLSARVEAGDPIELVDRPQLSTVPFRLQRRPAETLEVWGGRNARWLSAINARGHVYLSSTILPTRDGPAFTLRACVLSFRTHADRIDAALEDIAATVGMV